MSEILSLSEVDNIKKFGGKAVNLGKLVRAGLPVPEGFAVSIHAFDAKGKLAAEDRKQIKELLFDGKLYAVRSSAIVEDASGASWAGQFESYLNVEAKDVIKQIEACHNSSKARTAAYAKQQSVSKEMAAQVAVVVQEMVPAAYAGVMFTKNPSDGSNKIIIEYIAGLGEALVHGDADPERITWNRTKRTITEQTEATPPVPVPELIKLAEKIEHSFGGIPQDIEWAYVEKQIWIVQSRPITTLQERGIGKHYLGDPAKLFYWGPSRAKQLYISDFMAAFEQFFNRMAQDSILPDPPKIIVLFHDNKVVWLIKDRDFARFVSSTFSAYEHANRLENDIADWQKAVKNLDDYATQNSDIKQVAKLLNACWQATLFAEFSLYGAETAATQCLERFEPKVRQEIWGTMTLPDHPTFMQSVDIELAKSKNPQQLAKTYPWIQDGYSGVYKGAEQYFAKRLDIVAGNIELSAGSEHKRQAIIDRYKLTKKEVSVLNLARSLSIFMDERKAWMMRSRRYIALAAKQASKDIGCSLSEAEQSMLSVLSKDKATSIYGLTYMKTKNVTLDQNDVALAWDWYIEFRAAKSVLSGVVASTGGRHFITGEARLIGSPTDPVPDDCILVVPSTSPSYVPLMRKARALVTDHGGMMSHAAIVAREFGLPCIVGTKRATKLLKNGDKIVLDLVKGEVNR